MGRVGVGGVRVWVVGGIWRRGGPVRARWAGWARPAGPQMVQWGGGSAFFLFLVRFVFSFFYHFSFLFYFSCTLFFWFSKI